MEELLTVSEFAKKKGTYRETVYSNIKKGKIQATTDPNSNFGLLINWTAYKDFKFRQKRKNNDRDEE